MTQAPFPSADHTERFPLSSLWRLNTLTTSLTEMLDIPESFHWRGLFFLTFKL